MHRLMQYAGWTLQLAGFGIIAYHKGANQFKGVGVGLVHMIVGGFVTLVPQHSRSMHASALMLGPLTSWRP